MKNRLIITISDIKGTKSYNIHQLFRKFFFIILTATFILLAGSFLFINYLTSEVEQVKQSKKNQETQLNILKEKEDKLVSQNKLYSMQIKSKVQDIEELSSKLDEIHTIIGIEDDDTKEEITKKTLDTINENKKKYALNLIPNGKPLEKFRYSSNFGYRINPVTKKRQFHRGLDMAAPRKTPIRATADGIIEYVQSRNIGDYGRVVKVQHNYGFKTVYAHMEKTFVNVGDIIKKGQILGLVGNSGRSTAPHLHYEVRYANMVLNPRRFVDWNLSNFEEIFKKERKIEWESLVSLINSHQTQLR
ncbi:peptidase M23 [Malaciobacter pacificus]|uniref:Zinc metallopeptidase, M23 family n=1 Tax=Malaciobacter pacificus TaxID=1080223 RepID=A0A5C2H3P1_9BACT|nr:M23 family metallopeptidase [Malaciobacter pacificus]QEP33587.1 zinc metallopeptidase, M23 family [Malaciobacter pacificus]GGD39050.1 peptidase M23 [Malaciobacter pacificus]